MLLLLGYSWPTAILRDSIKSTRNLVSRWWFTVVLDLVVRVECRIRLVLLIAVYAFPHHGVLVDHMI